MSLSDCPNCWDTPCTCGYEYKDYPTERMIKWIKDIIRNRDDKDIIIQSLTKEQRELPKT